MLVDGGLADAHGAAEEEYQQGERDDADGVGQVLALGAVGFWSMTRWPLGIMRMPVVASITPKVQYMTRRAPYLSENQPTDQAQQVGKVTVALTKRRPGARHRKLST